MFEPQSDIEFAQIVGSNAQKTLKALLTSCAQSSIGLSAASAAPDPVLTLWVEWAEAFDRLDNFCAYQQRLETELFAIGGSRSVSAADWEATERVVGYRKAKKAEADASETEERVAEALCGTPAQSVIGVIAKLHAVLSRGEPSHDSDEYPWPQLRYVVNDLLRLDNRAC